MAVDDAYTKILLHLNTNFTDENGRSWTAGQGCAITTSQKKFGAGSAEFPATTNPYMYTADHADFVLGSGNWTWDFQIRFTSSGAAGQYPNLIGQNQDADNQFAIFRNVNANKLYCIQKDGGTTRWQFYMSWTPSLNQWYHLEISRGGNTPYMFIDGVSQAVTEDTAISGKTAANLAADLYFGLWASVTHWAGFLDEVRFSSGICRHTADFTAPSAEYGAAAVTPTFKPRVINF